jgi:hypothetical protein
VQKKHFFFEKKKQKTLAILLFAIPSAAARAQYIDTYLPTSVPGFDQSQGVAVLAQPRPAYEAQGVREGDFIIQTGIDESFGYNSNLLGTENALGSAFIETAPSIDVASDWSRDRLGLHAAIDHIEDIDAEDQSHTDGTVGLGGSYTVGRGDVTLGYTHLWQHENGTDIGAIASQTPIGYDVDDLRGEATFIAGRTAITPNFDLADYRFGSAAIGDATISQSYRDRLLASLGVTARYDTGGTDLLVVLQGIDSHYTEELSGQPTLDSRSVLALAGFDTDAARVWRYRLLAGVEYRSFAAAQFGARAAPIVEGSIIWTPSRMLTLTGTVTRSIEEPQSEGTDGYIYTQARLVADYELRRNILLQGRLGLQTADFLQGGGNYTYVSAGAGATWLLNRHIRISLNYDFVSQSGPLNHLGVVPLEDGELVGPVRLTGGTYTQSLIVARAHLAL